MSLYIQDASGNNYPLLLPTLEICEFIEKNVPVSRILPWVNRTPAWNGGTYGLGAIGGPSGEWQKSEIKIGTFFYPAYGVSRWGYGCFLISGNQLDSLLSAAYSVTAGSDVGANTTQNRLSLVMTAEGQKSGESIKPFVYLLPPYPLSRIPQTPGNTLSAIEDLEIEYFNSLYLITVVDTRYYLQWQPAMTIGSISLTTPTMVAWDDLLDFLSTDLGIIVQNAGDFAPEENYLYPSIAWNLNGEPAAQIMDAVAANLGCRFAANLDGTFYLKSFEDAQIALDADWDNAYSINRTMRSGGQDQFADFSALLPSTLTMRSPTRLCAGFPTSTNYPQYIFTTVQITDNADYGDFGNAAGFGPYDETTISSLVIKNTCLALLGMPELMPTPTNNDQLIALAQQIFNDYCNWKQISFDITWNGVANIVPSGFEDWIYWVYTETDCYTREVSCPLMGMDNQEFLHEDGDSLGGCQDMPPGTFTDGGPGFLFIGADMSSVYNGLLIDGRLKQVRVG